jgi:hypothetical protein
MRAERARPRRRAASAYGRHEGVYEDEDWTGLEDVVDHHLAHPGLYLRFGRIDVGHSRVRLDAEFRDEVLGGKTSERGLSCYFVERLGPDYVVEPVRASQASYQLPKTYFRDMVEVFLPAIANDQVWLLRGDLIPLPPYRYERYPEPVVVHDYATGSDGEPVLAPGSVRVVKRLTEAEVLDHVRYGDAHNPALGDYRVHGRTVRDQIAAGEHVLYRRDLRRRGRAAR